MLTKEIGDMLRKGDFEFLSRIAALPLIRSAIKFFFSPAYKVDKTLRKLQSLVIKYDTAAFTVSKDKIIVHTKDNLNFFYHPAMAFFNFYQTHEEASTKLVLNKIKKNSVVLDVGGNIGWYSLILAREKKCKAYVFEAVPFMQEILLENIRLNKMESRIHLVKKAVSDKNGYINITTNKFGTNHLTKTKSKDTQKVQTITIDSFCKQNNISEVGLIKADIEGAELLMLKGALNTLKKDKPYILIEIEEKHCRKFNYTPEEIFELLTSLGYTCKYVLNKSKVFQYCGTIQQNLSKGNNFFFEPS
jgi:FkbM family methyltransferase